MAQINLVPGSQYRLLVRRRRRVLYSLTMLLAGATVAAGIILSLLVSIAENTAQSVQQELHSVETQIAAASEQVKKIQLFEGRLASLDQLLANHRIWSLYLQEIERLLPPETILTSLKGNHSDRTLELSGTTPNIDSISVALANLQNQAPGHPTLFVTGTISNVVQVDQTGPAGELLGHRYAFKMSLTF